MDYYLTTQDHIIYKYIDYMSYRTETLAVEQASEGEGVWDGLALIKLRTHS